MHKSFVLQYVYFMPLHVSSTCAHHQEVKIVLYSIWYHHTYRCDDTRCCRCDDTRCCIIQFWLPDDQHMCSKHVVAWNKLIVKQKFCASSWLITEINILRFTVSKTSKQYEIVVSPQYQLISYTAICLTFCNTNIKMVIYNDKCTTKRF